MNTPYRTEPAATTVDEGDTGEQWILAGFTQVENAVLRDSENLSSMARLTYTILRSYGWQDEVCWPGMDRLCRDVGRSKPKVREYLRELESAGLISKRRRGLNKTNVYTFRRPLVDEEQRVIPNPDENPDLSPEGNTGFTPEGNTGSHEEYSRKEYSFPSGGGAREESNLGITAKDQTTKLIRAIRESGGHVTRHQMNRFGKDFRHLLENGDVNPDELGRIVTHIAREWSRIALTVDDAFGDVRSGRDLGKNRSSSARADSSATPPEAIKAIEADKELAQYTNLAREFDFRSELWPPYKMMQQLGSTNMDQQGTLRRLRKITCNAAGGFRDADEGADTPAAGMAALRAYDELHGLIGVANEHDFSSDAEPSTRTLCNLGQGNSKEESWGLFKRVQSVVRRAVADESEGSITDEERQKLREDFEDRMVEPPGEFVVYWNGSTSMLATKLAASILGRSATQTLDDEVREILDELKMEVAA